MKSERSDFHNEIALKGLTRVLLFPILARLSRCGPSGPVVIREVFQRPEQRTTEWDLEERPEWGASPAKPREPLRITKMQFTPRGEASVARSTW